MKMVWYEEYDFISNPFTIKPQEGYEDFYGQKEAVKKISKVVNKGGFSLVYGPYGVGKTTVMKGIIDQFRGKRKVVYYNAYTSERRIDYDDILVRGGSWLSTFFGIKSKDMILLLDEAHNLMKADFEDLADYYNEGYFKAVVLVTSWTKHIFPEEIERLIGDNRVELKMFSEADAVKLCQDRLEGVELMDTPLIKKVYKVSTTPRDFMMKCEEACRRAVERGAEKVADEDLEDL